MTLPEQADRAVAQTRAFLLRLASPYVEEGIKGIRREVRAEALALLRHYPYVWLSQKCDCPESDNAANRDNTPATHSTPPESSKQSRCTLTYAERAAVEWFSRFDRPQNGPVIGRHAAALRSLLSRTGSVGDKTNRLASEAGQNEETNPERERLRQVLSQENDGTETCEK